MTKEKQRLLELAQTATKEGRQVDFKERFDPLSPQDWARIIKDVIAMANSGGGVILFGIKDDGSYSNFDRNTIIGIDPAVVADKISSYTREDFSEFEILEITRKKRRLAGILIFSTPTPIVFTRAGTDVTEDKGKQKPAFVKGSVYFRHGAKSEPGTTSDIKSVIDRVVSRIKKSWLQGIRKVASIQEGEEVIVSRKETATTTIPTQRVLGKIVTNKDAPSFRLENPREVWPFRTKELVAEINERLDGEKTITIHDILCIRRRHNINENTTPDYVYKPYQDLSPRYSVPFASWILGSYKKSQKFFDEAREYIKKSKSRHE